MNHISLAGRVARKNELKVTNNGDANIRFTVAANRHVKSADGTYAADFIPVSVWRKTAEYVNKYIQVGDLVEVEGRLRVDSTKDRDGKYTTYWEVSGERVNILSRKGGGQSADGAPAQDPAGVQGGFDDYEMDNAEIPF